MIIAYLIAWSGGYEPAQYAAFEERSEAIATAVTWAKDMDRSQDAADYIDILSLERTHNTRTMRIDIERVELTPEEQNLFDTLSTEEEE